MYVGKGAGSVGGDGNGGGVSSIIRERDLHCTRQSASAAALTFQMANCELRTAATDAAAAAAAAALQKIIIDCNAVVQIVILMNSSCLLSIFL